MPGPGNYNDTDRSRMGRSGIKISLGVKRAEVKLTTSPGPGSYDRRDSITRNKSQSIKFSNSKRVAITS